MSEQMTLSLRIKSPEFERQLKEIEKVFKVTGGASGGTGKIAPGLDQFRKLNEGVAKLQLPMTAQVEAATSMLGPLKLIAKNVLPLVGIGVGIAAMVALSKKSSGVLTGTFKVIQTSMLLSLQFLCLLYQLGR